MNPKEQQALQEKAQAIEDNLTQDGFRNISAVQDEPNKYYDEHDHPYPSTHVILTGSLYLTLQGVTKELRSGDRCEIPEGAKHSVKIGLEGCVYVTAER
ncbi:MAG: hypothetical protein COU08_02975 [Candidatus Harrisonbacteria bacterium CG10_big_fil_rev_8_21_14_0_10_42_17]|uniref:Cupin 2 conserved barrel domain-containing protein n=1 Tax=Candidatus Harrisonbacteria bacterium CG10_big_fil_rev_8_21_14_0_10_42_17 TaxID=1974584 RepID=A0A2M6WHS2_9BACT|nr:MAG: hypothetical protein COU08_02975 [Candidatus Harrisonbacteria bacterium CG10_big_fil_rev_8_21_14_0_10_42_17]